MCKARSLVKCLVEAESSWDRRQSWQFSTKDNTKSFLRRHKGFIFSSSSILFTDYTAKIILVWMLYGNFTFLEARKGGTQHPPASAQNCLAQKLILAWWQGDVFPQAFFILNTEPKGDLHMAYTLGTKL